MSASLPGPVANLVKQIQRLPGMGPKSALRMAITLLDWPESETRRFGESIFNLRDEIKTCSRCGNLADSAICGVCADPSRQEDILCVVPDWESLLIIEEGGFFSGQYLVLGGLMSHLKDRGSQSLELGRLEDRLKEGNVRELVLGLGSTLEAENTVSYLKEFVSRRFPAIKISRFAQGMPLGAQIKFMDSETLRQSLKFRQDLGTEN